MPPMRLRALVLALAFAVPLATGVPCALAGSPDADGDGVADVLDVCADTPPYEAVDAAGCSACPCDADWSSRTAYLRCVYGAVRARRQAGGLGTKDGRAIAKAARASTCGHATRVRCCVLFPEKGTGLCRVMDELRCDGEMLRTEAVVDAGGGSCLPNPCAP
jgi:hypothetical protein